MSSDSGDDLVKELRDSMRQLYLSGDHSDFTIECGTASFAVHKAIFCPRSKFFEAVFKHDMKEKATNVLKFEDDNLPMVESMIQCLYLLDYTPDIDTNRPSKTVVDVPNGSAAFVSKESMESDNIPAGQKGEGFEESELLEAIAEPKPKLEPEQQVMEIEAPAKPEPVPDTETEEFLMVKQEIVYYSQKKEGRGKLLKKDQKRLDELLSRMQAWDPAKPADPEPDFLLYHARVYAFAEQYQIPSLKSLATKKFKPRVVSDAEFIAAAREVYTSTPDADRVLRDEVVRTVRGRPELLDIEDMRQVLRDTRLAYDLVLEARRTGTAQT